MLMQDTFQKTPVGLLVLRLGIPALAGQFFNVFYSIVDRIFVGHIAGSGVLSLAAIGICAPVLNMISCITILIGAGGSSVFSIFVGGKRPDSAQDTIDNAFFLFLLLGAVLTLLLFGARKPLLLALGCTADIYPLASSYFSVYILGTLCVFLGTGMNYFLLAQGYAKQGMTAVIIGAVVNALLDPLFIFLFHWNIRGAAIATILAQACTMLYVLFQLQTKPGSIRPHFRLPNAQILRKIFTIGGFYFLVNVLDQWILLFLNLTLQRYCHPSETALYITCAAIVQSFMSIAYIPANGVTSGCGTLFSFFYGSRDFQKLFSVFNYVLLLCLCFMSALWIFTRTAPELLLRVFASDPEVIALSVKAVQKYATGLPLVAAQFAFVHGLAAIGRIKYAFPLSMIRKSIFVLCIIFLPRYCALEEIFWSGCIADISGAALCILLFYLVITPRLRRSMNQTP